MFDVKKKEMKVCPFCGGKLQKGIIEILNVKDFSGEMTSIEYIPEEDKDKFWNVRMTSLEKTPDGYYCETCEYYFGVYEKEIL